VRESPLSYEGYFKPFEEGDAYNHLPGTGKISDSIKM